MTHNTQVTHPKIWVKCVYNIFVYIVMIVITCLFLIYKVDKCYSNFRRVRTNVRLRQAWKNKIKNILRYGMECVGFKYHIYIGTHLSLVLSTASSTHEFVLWHSPRSNEATMQKEINHSLVSSWSVSMTICTRIVYLLFSISRLSIFLWFGWML